MSTEHDADTDDRIEPSTDMSVRSTANSTCDNCGAHVSREFRRVAGDNDDRVSACPACHGTVGVCDAAGRHVDSYIRRSAQTKLASETGDTRPNASWNVGNDGNDGNGEGGVSTDGGSTDGTGDKSGDSGSDR